MKITKRDVKMLLIGALIMTAVILPVNFIKTVFAEQTGNSPESGTSSRIKETYDSLIFYGYGTETAGSWGDWGAFWNRIRSAAEWTPEGTVTGDKVANGETFYGNSRTLQTGTGQMAMDYSLQSTAFYDDSLGYFWGTGSPEDSQEEESTWSPLTANNQTAWKDERTGLYWTTDQGYRQNIFDTDTCDFFFTADRGSYNGSDLDCGGTQQTPHAINYCAGLTFAGRSDWYLPTYKELLQAHLDGMFNKAGTNQVEAAEFTWGTTNGGGDPSWASSGTGWSSTIAWMINLSTGNAIYPTKNSQAPVRCVSRD